MDNNKLWPTGRDSREGAGHLGDKLLEQIFSINIIFTVFFTKSYFFSVHLLLDKFK